MSTSTFYALVLIPIIVCYVALRKRTLRSQVPPTCRSPRKLPQNILALGIDHFWKTLKLRQQHRSLKTIADWHNTYGSTFIAKSIGKQIFHTWHPDNLKAIFGTKWKDWGTGRFQAMDPFCGRGFVTTDGEEWKGHRALLAPTLTEANAIDLDALNLAYNEYLAGLPVDGATVNLAPVFDELVSVS
jgi:cytochrome P450